METKYNRETLEKVVVAVMLLRDTEGRLVAPQLNQVLKEEIVRQVYELPKEQGE